MDAYPADLAKRLRYAQREMLVDHVDGPLPINVHPGADARNERRTVTSLKNMGLLAEKGGSPSRPRTTALTDDGRAVLAAVLADYAESLVRAGRLDDVAGLKLRPTALEEVRLMRYWPL